MTLIYSQRAHCYLQPFLSLVIRNLSEKPKLGIINEDLFLFGVIYPLRTPKVFGVLSITTDCVLVKYIRQ